MIHNNHPSFLSPHLYRYHPPIRIHNCPVKTFVIIINIVIIYLTVVSATTTTSGFIVVVRSNNNDGSCDTVGDDDPQVQPQRKQQQQQQFYSLKQFNRVKKCYMLPIMTTDTIVDKRWRTTTTTNSITHQLRYSRNRIHYYYYYPPNSFLPPTANGSRINSAIDRRYRTSSSTLMSSATAALFTTTTTKVVGNTIYDTTTRFLCELSQTSTISVALTLLVSAFCGLLVEQQQQQQQQTQPTERNSGKDWKPYVPPSIVVTLTISTTLVYTLRKVMSYQLPQQHCIYDFCWSTLLPSSLALLLFSLSSSSSSSIRARTHHFHSNASTTAVGAQQQQQQSTFATIQRLAIPFLIASVGSIIGCFASFLLCYYNPYILLSVPEARQVIACLCASFIGGSINFFATSVILQHQQLNVAHGSSISNSNSHALLSAMAAVDIVVMAFYFTFLSAALQSQRLHRWFNNGETNDDEDNVHDKNTSNVDVDTTQLVVANSIDDEKHCIVATGEAKTSSTILIPAVLSIGALTLVLVEISKRIEVFIAKYFGIPGTACAFLAISVSWITTQIHNCCCNYNPFTDAMQRCSEPMSRLAFLLVFATMGCTADLSSTLYNGPACLIISLTALVIHGMVTVFGSLLFRRLLLTKGSKKIDLTDMLIASNAAIGGPATAAAFCGEIKKNLNPIDKRHLTIAATVWGVVGYAIGTTVGVTLFRILQLFV